MTDPVRKVGGMTQSCPRCGTELDDENYCSWHDEVITDGEIAQHEEQWGDLWVTGA